MSDLEQMSAEQEDRDLQAALLGVEVDKFLASRLGKFIIQRAESEIEALRHRLEAVDPTNAGQVAAIQNEIWVRKNIGIWLREAANAGASAEARIREEDETTH